MSRGYGYVQRFVLEELDERWAAGDPWADARTLAERLVGTPPTRHACRSVGRALRLLAADGLVELEGTRRGVRGRVALARIDDVEARRARRTEARELRRRLYQDAPRAGAASH